MRLADVIMTPAHSLFSQSLDGQVAAGQHMSLASFESVLNFLHRNHRVNVDGCGVSFFLPKSPDSDEMVIGLFRTTQPIANCQNLKSLASVILSKRFFAHIRATSGSAVAECNTHPFVFSPMSRSGISFMHNGCVAKFKVIQRGLVADLSESTFSQIQGFFCLLFLCFLFAKQNIGTTDSETLGAICWEYLRAHFGSGPYRGVELAMALQHTIGMVLRHTDLWCQRNRVSFGCLPSSLNMAICSARAVAVRHKKHVFFFLNQQEIGDQISQ